MRINRFLAKSTGFSRRKSEDLVSHGRVAINGKIIDSLSVQVSNLDVVAVDGKEIKISESIYYLLNKPRGYTSSSKDVYAKKLVTSLVPKFPRVFTVGRLDKESSGLIILTNDGELSYYLTHPKFEKEKEYEVTTTTPLTMDGIKEFSEGIKLEEGLTAPAKITKIKDCEYRIIIKEGKNRQIRRMINKIGSNVTGLKRVRIGNLKLEDMKVGCYRKISKNEIESTFK